MKKKDLEKINTIGLELGVDLSDNKQKIGRILYFIIQGLVTLGSIILGISFGYEGVGYPYISLISWSNFGVGLFFELLIHAGNGIFVILKEERFGISRSQRKKIFLGNFILSFVLLVISYGIALYFKPRVGI